MLVNVSSSCTVFELKRLLVAEIPGNLKIEVLTKGSFFILNGNVVLCLSSSNILGSEADLPGPPHA